MIRSGLLVILLAAAAGPVAAEDLKQTILAAGSNAERECLLRANGGATPELLLSLRTALENLERRKPADVRELAFFLEGLAREHRDYVLLAKALNRIGLTYFDERQPALSEPYDREALEISRFLGEDEMIAAHLLAVGIGASTRGETGEARELLREALELTKRERTAALVHNSLAIAERKAGNLAASTAEFEAALALFEQLGEEAAIAGVRNNLGNTAQQLGDLDLAARWFEEALDLATRSKSESIRSYALNNLSVIATRRNRLDEAQRWLEQSLAIKERLGDRSGIVSAYLNLGEVARRKGRFVDAFRLGLRARVLAAAIGARAPVAEAEGNLALAALENATPHVALHFADRAIAVSRGNLPVVQVTAATVRGDALVALGRRVEAREAYAEGIAAVESQRQQAGGSQQQRTFFLESRLHPYLAMADLLAESEPAEALRYAEEAKARVLRDLLQRDGAAPGAREALPPGTVAIEFVVTSRRTLAFVVTAKGVQMRTVALGADELAKEVKALRQSVAQRDLGFDAASARLFQRLLGGVWPLAKSAETLVFVPDGPLWELPFQALRTTDGYLVEKLPIVYAPSLATFAEMRASAARHRGSPRTLLAFGDPPASSGAVPLPEASRQIESIAKLYGRRSRVFLGAAASESRLRAEIAGARVVQLATHGILNDRNPLYSHLRFASGGGEDGTLEAREIAQLRLESELVVLSSCDSGRGTVREGEGVIGMAWAFFVAGCPSTVVSQWSVDSTSTADAMVRFHEELQKGASKSSALRQAALHLLRNPRFRHPFYWAGFIVIGDDSPMR